MITNTWILAFNNLVLRKRQKNWIHSQLNFCAQKGGKFVIANGFFFFVLIYFIEMNDSYTSTLEQKINKNEEIQRKYSMCIAL